MRFARIEIQREVLDIRRSQSSIPNLYDATRHRLRCSLGRLKRNVFSYSSIRTKEFKVIPGQRSPDRLVVLAHNPVLATDIERIDHIALTRADSGRTTFPSSTQDCPFAIELVPTSQSCFDDHKVLMRQPPFRLRCDDLPILEFRSVILMQRKVNISHSNLCVDARRMFCQVACESSLRLNKPLSQ